MAHDSVGVLTMADDENLTKRGAEQDERLGLGRFRQPRRRVLALSALLGAGAVRGVPFVSADEEPPAADQPVDQPEGFSVEGVAAPARFPDQVAAEFRVSYDDGDVDVATLDEASTVVIAKATWQPGGTSGWHRHPGVGIVNVVEGELELTHADDCRTHTYTAGEAYVEPPQNIHVARNPSQTDRAVVYGTFLGVPEGASPQEMVRPADC